MPLIKKTVLGLAAVSTCLLLIVSPVQADPMGMIVPAYFYPSWWDPVANFWDDLTLAASQVPIIAIMNPSNGSGSTLNPDYVQEVNNFRAAGGQVVGYVYTEYGARPDSQWQGEVDNYYNWYNIDGIFFDQSSNLSGDVGYYAQLHDYVTNKGGMVIGNPGVNTIEDYISTATTLNIFENNTNEYPGWDPSSWTSNYPPSSFSNMVYGVSDQSTMENYVNLARSRNVDWIYITDDTLTNPWDTLPSYWEQEVMAVAAVPEPATVLLLIIGASFLFKFTNRRIIINV